MTSLKKYLVNKMQEIYGLVAIWIVMLVLSLVVEENTVL